MLHHEKFFTVVLLIGGILLLAYAPVFAPSTFVAQKLADGGVVVDPSGPLRILDIATGGLLLALGNATGGQRSSTEQAVAAGTAQAAVQNSTHAPAERMEHAVHSGARDGVAEGLDHALGEPPRSTGKAIGHPASSPARARETETAGGATWPPR